MDARLGTASASYRTIGPCTDAFDHPGERLIEPSEWPAIASELGLTTREWQVMILLFQGKTREAIAGELRIKTRTVRQYVEQLHVKLEVQDRVELVLRIVECRDHLRATTRSSFD